MRKLYKVLQSKQCIKCHKELSIEFFYKQKDSKDGYNPRCKPCLNEYASKSIQKRNADPIRRMKYLRRQRRLNKKINNDPILYKRRQESYKKFRRTTKYKWNEFKTAVKKRGEPLLISKEDYLGLISDVCNYCGDTLENTIGHCLDRVNSSKGYVISNVVPCCKVCNRMKLAQSLDDFLAQCYKITERYINGKINRHATNKNKRKRLRKVNG